MNASPPRRRYSVTGDLLLVFRRIRSPHEARRLARGSGWLILLAGVIVVLLGALMQHTGSMLEGTLVALLALVAGWARSRVAATLLAALITLGLAGGLLGGGPAPTLIFLATILAVSLRLLEATFRFRGNSSS
jgi:type IV secretion system protein TrbC